MQAERDGPSVVPTLDVVFQCRQPYLVDSMSRTNAFAVYVPLAHMILPQVVSAGVFIVIQ